MTGIVTATSLNLRSKPTIESLPIAVLRSGTSVTILQQDADWFRVSTGAGIGFLSAEFVKLDPATADAAAAPAVPLAAVQPSAMPPRDDGTITTDDDHAFAPDGLIFAYRSPRGFHTSGATSLNTYLATAGASVAAMPPSKLRVVQAVSLNEGNLEAINSYDNSFMSFGLFQWTAGAAGDPGELAGLMDRIKRRDEDRFREYFRSFDLDAVITHAGKLNVGFLMLKGNRLDSPEAKAPLREAEWAYRFWRAAHDDTVRICQIELALARIDAFYDESITVLAGGTTRTVNQYITSEFGVSLLLDEHVNRPGHVPDTLEKGILDYVSDTHRADPATWTTDDERNVIQAYIRIRNETNMTGSQKRAEKIAQDGHVSTQRGSFVRS